MKAGYDARIRAKAEKEHDRMVAEEARRRDEEARLTDPQGWLRSMRQKHEVSAVASSYNWTLAERLLSRPVGDDREDQGAQETERAALGSQKSGGAEQDEVDSQPRR